MDELLKLLKQNALETPRNLAKMLNISEEEVRARIDQYEKKGVIRGYQAIVDEDLLDLEKVQAVIEIRTTPERHGGFDRLATRIGKFSEVHSLFLMSGGYDLLAIVQGESLKKVAFFVSEKLATLDGVISTSTHFMLKTYKAHDLLMQADDEREILKVSP